MLRTLYFLFYFCLGSGGELRRRSGRRRRSGCRAGLDESSCVGCGQRLEDGQEGRERELGCGAGEGQLRGDWERLRVLVLRKQEGGAGRRAGFM